MKDPDKSWPDAES